MTARTRIVIVGGGIAGVETALTLARTVPRAHVMVVSQWPSMRVLPNMVYVPFGAAGTGVDVRLNRAFARDGIELVIDTCTRVDLERRTLQFASGDTLAFDVLIMTPGTVSEPSSAHQLRSLDGAVRINQELEALAAEPAREKSVLVRVPSGATWSAPAFEFALLLAEWRDTHGTQDISIHLEVEESEPLDLFDFHSSAIVREALTAAGVELMTRVPSHRMDLVPSSVAIAFDGLTARRLPGMPPVNADGFYSTDSTGRVAPDVYVVGDASSSPYKAAFAAGLQARTIARTLGGDLGQLGDNIDGIPVNECEYQMDLGGDTLSIRFRQRMLGEGYGHLHVADSTVIASARPNKLVGLLVHAIVNQSELVPVSLSRTA